MNAVDVTQVKVMNEPVNLPWRAVRREVGNYVWFEVIDNKGHEVLKTETSPPEDEHLAFQHVCFTLSMVNQNDNVVIDGVEVRTVWRG